MNIDKIRKRTKRFLKQRPKQDKQARETLAKFPRWKDDTAQHLAVETLIILYDTFRREQGSKGAGEQGSKKLTRSPAHRMGVLEAYLESINTYSQRWVDWRGATDKGGDEDEDVNPEADLERGN